MSESNVLLRPHLAPRLPGPAHPHAGLIPRMRTGARLEPQRLEAHRLIHAEHPAERDVNLFRELRTRLLQAANIANPVILVTGVRANCGASFVARNLAAAIALDEDRTSLLVDCNLRRPTADKVFDIDGAGLADFLRDPALGAEAILHPVGIPRLRVIPAGNSPAHAGDRLASARMRALVDELRGRYADRCIVLDAPAARGAPEARMLAERADLVVMVAGEGLHTGNEVLEAARTFEPSRFAGVVFNRLP
jgi:Mrp family chromosome partitioning ATPase